MCRAQEFLTSRLGQIVKIEPIAEQFGVSYSALRHGFKRRVGMSPKQYHLHVRLRKACELLQNTDLSISQISDALGFASPFHLSSCFKSHLQLRSVRLATEELSRTHDRIWYGYRRSRTTGECPLKNQHAILFPSR